MRTSKKLSLIPPYLFAEIDRLQAEAKAKGVDVISLGVGDPDMPTPSNVIEKLKEAVSKPENHDYPPYEGTKTFRHAVVCWYKKRFGVALDEDTEVLSLIGSKEGIAHVPLAFIDSGDFVLVPDPAYPVYKTGTILAGGHPISMPLFKRNNFLPKLESIHTEIAKRCKILFLNYPNNPTGAVASLEFFAEAVTFAKKYDLLICHDNAYSEIGFDSYQPPSILQVEGAKDVTIEFNSLSKPYNMTGWRLGYAVGNKQAVNALGTVKKNIDSGVFKAIQESGIEALENNETTIKQMRGIYQKRRDLVVDTLTELGWKTEKPQAAFYVWVAIPDGYNSQSFTLEILNKCGVLVSPGNGYGDYGEGFIRMSLTAPTKRIEEAMARIKKCFTKLKA